MNEQSKSDMPLQLVQSWGIIMFVFLKVDFLCFFFCFVFLLLLFIIIDIYIAKCTKESDLKSMYQMEEVHSLIPTHVRVLFGLFFV